MTRQQGFNMRVVDRTMLKRGDEIWANMNKGGKEFENHVKKFFKRDWWKQMNEGGREFDKRVKEAFQEVTKVPSHNSGRNHRYNLLGGSYKKLSAGYSKGASLGEGGFGKVYEVEEKATGKTFACKEISKTRLFSEGYQDMAMTEINVMNRLTGGDADNPCLMRMHEAFEDKERLYLILELCKGGDVLSSVAKHFKEEGSYTEANAAALMRMMLEAVQLCHDKGVAHRDLKPDNFLWTGTDCTGQLKLADFGLSDFLPEEGKYMTDRCGTPPYMAPELWRHQEYRTEPDVWALGVTMTVLLTGKYPFIFSSYEECAEATCTAVIDWEKQPWTMISHGAKDVLKQMLEKDPRKRITIPQALAHPWMREGGTAPTTSVTGNIASGLEKMMHMNQLHQAAMRLLVLDTKEHDEITFERMTETYATLDLDGDGKVSKEDFRRAMKHLSHKMSRAEEDDVLDSIDTDGDGVISFDEFLAAAIHMRSQADEFRMVDAFNLFDKDGDGYISKLEMSAALKEVGMTVTEEIKRIFRLLDVDGDGQVSYEEFGNFWNQYVRQGDASQARPRHTTAMRRGSYDSEEIDNDQMSSEETDPSSAYFNGLVQASTISFASAISASISFTAPQRV